MMGMMGRWRGVLGTTLAAAILLGALTTTTSPFLPAPASPARQWRATLAESDGVEIDFYLTLRFRTSTTWELYSREGGARPQVSWLTWTAAGLLGKRPAHGALVAVTNGTATTEGDAVALRGQLTSPFLGQRWFVGRLEGERWHAELRQGSETGIVAGTIDAVPAASTPGNPPLPVRDYAALAAEVRRTISDSIYDPSLPGQPAYRRFFTDLTTSFARARDDLDVIAGFEAARSRLGTSHFRFVRNPSLAATPLDTLIAGDPTINPDDLVRLGFPAPGIALLRVTRWDRATGPIDRAFARLTAARVSTLILDIRGNPGGDATSMSPLAHVMERPVAAGVFLSRPWFAVHPRPPAGDELAQLPVMSADSPPHDFMRELLDGGTVVGRVEPRAPQFTGAIFVAVDARTGSASEPLAHLLKSTGRATVVGERTPGAMLLALPQPLTDGFIVVVPRADYYTAEGIRLEGRGVEPDLPCASNEALVVIAQRIRRTQPYAGNLLLGGVYMSLRRWDAAERGYRTAFTLAPTDADRAIVQRQLEALSNARPR